MGLENTQKRVDETSRHAFNSYVPLEGLTDDVHFVEKYPQPPSYGVVIDDNSLYPTDYIESYPYDDDDGIYGAFPLELVEDREVIAPTGDKTGDEFSSFLMRTGGRHPLDAIFIEDRKLPTMKTDSSQTWLPKFLLSGSSKDFGKAYKIDDGKGDNSWSKLPLFYDYSNPLEHGDESMEIDDDNSDAKPEPDVKIVEKNFAYIASEPK